MAKIRAFVAALLFLGLLGLPGAGMAQSCVSGRDGRQLLEQGEVVPLPEAMRRAGLKRDQVVEVQLCQAGGGFVYRVRVLQPGGQVRSVDIPAS